MTAKLVFAVKIRDFGLVPQKLKAFSADWNGIRKMPVLRLQYVAYVDVKVSSTLAEMFKNGKLSYTNKWGSIHFKGPENEYIELAGVPVDVDYKRADDDEWYSEDGKDDTWCEKCCGCDKWLGDKIFTDENEFDNHPDREEGYDDDGNWWCPDCKPEESESECSECEEKPKVVEPLPVPDRGRPGSPKPQPHPSKGFTIDKLGYCDCCNPPKYHPELLKKNGPQNTIIRHPFPQLPRQEFHHCDKCNVYIGSFGNNPKPLKYKYVCDECNYRYVVPCRMEIHQKMGHIDRSCVHSESVKASMRAEMTEDTIQKYMNADFKAGKSN
jgi:hypothetical protein